MILKRKFNMFIGTASVYIHYNEKVNVQKCIFVYMRSDEKSKCVKNTYFIEETKQIFLEGGGSLEYF